MFVCTQYCLFRLKSHSECYFVSCYFPLLTKQGYPLPSSAPKASALNSGTSFLMVVFVPVSSLFLYMYAHRQIHTHTHTQSSGQYATLSSCLCTRSNQLLAVFSFVVLISVFSVIGVSCVTSLSTAKMSLISLPYVNTKEK